MGDIHLRDAQYANQGRSYDFIAAFEQAIHVSRDADVIVCAGDIFDTSRPSPKVIGQLIRVDHLLQAMGMTMLCITGNHDRTSPTWLDTLFPRVAGPGIVPLDDRTTMIKGFKFAGIPPYTANQFRSKSDHINSLCHDADVVLYHGLVTGVVPMRVGADSTPLTVDEMPSWPSIKAVLLADIHIQGHIHHVTPTCSKLIAYPGSTEMCSSSEALEKSVPMVRVTKTTAVVERTEKLTTRLFIAAKVRSTEELDVLVERLREVANKNPVAVIEFDRSITDVITRVHAALDADKALIRCKALPSNGADYVRQTVTENDGRTIREFMSERFAYDIELEALAVALVDRGEDDADNIMAEFIERNLAQAL